MLETPHVVLGAAIAIKTGNPWIAIPLAFTSHFLLEVVPHWNPHLNTEIKLHGKLTNRTRTIIAIDVFVSLVIGGYIAYTTLPNSSLALTVLLSSFSAVLPDLIEGPYFFFGVKNKFLMWWLKTQKAIQVDTTPLWGLLTQGLTLIATLYWIFS